MLKLKITATFILACLLFCCAAGKDGEIIVNKETIEDFFEKDQKSWSPPSDLDLAITQKVTPAELPPIPAGEIRVCGTLDSAGPYQTEAPKEASFQGSTARGSVFKDSLFGLLGPAGKGGGNAWFYADIDPVTGVASSARAYLYGFNGGVCDMRQNPKISFGLIQPGSFTFTIEGPCLFPQVSGSASDFALLVQAKRNPLKLAQGGEMPIRYIVDGNGEFDAIPLHPQNWWAVRDYGDGEVFVKK